MRILSLSLLALLFIPAGLLYSQSIVTVNAGDAKTIISKNIYGHFAEHLGHCIYDGFYVGDTNKTIPNTRGVRNDVIAALKKMKIPVLRWPGGCFADTYHWKDGIGPKNQRPSIVNKWWGGVTEDNSFGT
ncbi:MAG TPA: alpha-N-arabinofuranosidase, partial [Chitinophagaceae bacterium]